MKLPASCLGVLCAVGLMLTACADLAPVGSASREPEVLIIHPDGTMKLGDRYLPADDVVIYPDGTGGEQAAIKVRIDSLHPDFYRGTIVVKRIGAEGAGSGQDERHD